MKIVKESLEKDLNMLLGANSGFQMLIPPTKTHVKAAEVAKQKARAPAENLIFKWTVVTDRGKGQCKLSIAVYGRYCRREQSRSCQGRLRKGKKTWLFRGRSRRRVS